MSPICVSCFPFFRQSSTARRQSDIRQSEIGVSVYTLSSLWATLHPSPCTSLTIPLYFSCTILRCRSILPQSVFQPVLASFVALRAVAALWFANLQRRCSRNNFFYSAPGVTGRSRLSIALEETRPQGQSYAARRSRTSTQQQINHSSIISRRQQCDRQCMCTYE